MTFTKITIKHPEIDGLDSPGVRWECERCGDYATFSEAAHWNGAIAAAGERNARHNEGCRDIECDCGYTHNPYVQSCGQVSGRFAQ